MPVFSPDSLTRFAIQGENELSIEYPVILDRLSLAITAGQPILTLPDYVVSIQRITYKGFKLDPLTHRDAREIFQGANQQSKPFWYIFNNIGQNQIKLFPVPVENIAANQTGLYGANIPNLFIVTFYRTPDFSNFVIPLYFRRRLLKAYVAKMCFGIESKGQSLRNADYFDKKWELLKQMYMNTMGELHNKPRKLIISESINYGFNKPFPAPPILPVGRFGVGVDPGE